MLRISKLADYGTVVMVYLARKAGTLCNARDVASHTGISVPMASKLLKKLVLADLLRSVRGASGGYILSYEPKDISVLDIIHALEDYKGLTECSHASSECFLQGVCQVEGNFRLINQAIEVALQSVNLEELAKPGLSKETLHRISEMLKPAS